MKGNLARLVPLFVGMACAASSLVSQAQDPNAHLYIAHAAPGRNVSTTTNPEYPVDISIGGHCLVQGASFGEIRGPFTLPPGTYAANVSVANSIDPCSNPNVFAAPIALTAGTTSLGIVTVNSAAKVVGEITTVDLGTVPAGDGRLFVVNTTPDNLTGALDAGDTTTTAESASIGAGMILDRPIPVGAYLGSVYPEGSTTRATGPVSLDVSSRNIYILIVAGSTANNSIQLVGPKIIRDVL